MKLGVRAHDFGRQTAAQLAKSIKNAGFECVQLAPAKGIEGINHFNDITDAHLHDIHAAFAQNNVEITVLGCYIEPSLADTAARLEQVEIFRNNLSHAKNLGVNLVGTETTHLPITATESEREAAYQRLKDSVLRMVEQAEKENVFVGIEPVADHTLNTPELARRLLDEVNSIRLKIIFDPVNLILPATVGAQAQIFNRAITLLGADVMAMHIKDITIENEQKVWCNISTGVIDYTSITEWLRKNHPNMRLLREEVRMDSYAQDLEAMKKFII